MTPEQVDRVFGRERLKMVTGEHVEVYREAVAPGEPRRYTKRFLATPNGDFGPWTEREWRILARLIGHGIRCVPEVVQFDAGAKHGMRRVQTCDAGVTVDQWATLVPVVRNGAVRRNIFEDCAHWWALARHCLVALNEIHALELVHLDIKADNICIPYAPADFDPDGDDDRLYPAFARLALIDFAFSLVSRESLALPLPLGWQKDYDYQSPRLLKALEAGRNGDLEPTRVLDWRCDFYSLAAMLKRYLPSDHRGADGSETGWTSSRYDDARSLIFRLRDTHDRDLPHWRPHGELIDFCGARLDESDLAASLQIGWTLARGEVAAGTATPITPITPVTRIATLGRVAEVTPLTHIASAEPIVLPELVAAGAARAEVAAIGPYLPPRPEIRAPWRAKLLLLSLVAGVAASAPSFIGDSGDPLRERTSGASGESGAVSPPQVPNSTSSADSAPAATASAPDLANPAANGNDPVAQPQRDGVARVAPPPGIGASSGLATEEPRPASETPREQAGAADAARAPESTTAEKASSSPGATARERAPSNAPQPRVQPSATGKRAPVSSRSSVASSATPTLHGRAASSSRASARVRSAPRPPASLVARSTSPAARVRVATAKPPVTVSSQTAPLPSSPPPLAGQTVAPVAQLEPAPGASGAGVAIALAVENSRSPVSPEPAPLRAPESGAEERSSTAPAKPAPKPSPPKNGWQALLGRIVGLVQARDRPPAPVEERDVRRSQAAAQSPMPQRSGSVTTKPPSGQFALAAAPGASPKPAPIPPTLRSGEATDAPPSGAVFLGGAESPRASAPAAVPVPRAIEPPMPARSAPDASFGVSAAGVPSPPTRGVPPQAADASAAIERTVRPSVEPDPLTVQAKQMLAEAVPRIAAQAQHDVTPVLRAAGLPPHPMQAETIAEVAHAKWISEQEW
ncbi:MAG TPA: hypothetical protein VH704_14470, partial [Casimicrobiaceae bacterium]|nr:hypothetical protein [Casimicrobiaceae bacterium]